jgi:hypothetical protein
MLVMLAICQGWNPQKLEQDEETCKIMYIGKTFRVINYVDIKFLFCATTNSRRKHLKFMLEP